MRVSVPRSTLFLAYYYNLAAQEDHKGGCLLQTGCHSPFGSGIVEMGREDTERPQTFRGKWIPRSPVILGVMQDLAYKTSKGATKFS